MKTLPNGLKIFNATPHAIRFWREGWQGPVEVEPDQIISAALSEAERAIYASEEKAPYLRRKDHMMEISFVSMSLMPQADGEATAQRAYENGADVVVGSIVAAQVYPGLVVAMVPAPGYERVGTAEKRMSPDKFTVF